MAQIGRLVVRVVAIGAATLFVLAIPLAVALTNFRWFVQGPANYLQGQERQAVSSTTGLGRDELALIDSGMVRYFQSGRESLLPSLRAAGVQRSPFSERDAAHLLDVHDLIQGALNLQWLAFSYSLIFIAAAVLAGARRLTARCILYGSILTIALIGLLGLLSLLDWNALFLEFHFISFSNNLWQLDPSRDALIRLYPPGFFMDATLELVLMSLVEALVLAVVAGFYLHRSGHKAWRMA